MYLWSMELLHVLFFLTTCCPFLCTSRPSPDWLIETISTDVTLTTPDSSSLVLSNGLISRSFLLSPNFGTFDFISHQTERSLLRAITTEATITLDGVQYNVGGLNSSSGNHAYLNRSDIIIESDPNAFQYVGYTFSEPQAPFHWEPGLRFSPKSSQWPPKGLHLQVNFKAPYNVTLPSHSLVTVSLHYEMYQGAPIMSKWLSVSYTNSTPIAPVKINAVNVEYLAIQKPYAPLNYSPLAEPWQLGPGLTSSSLYVETDQCHGTNIAWIDDPQENSGASEPILVCNYYEGGPGVVMANVPGKSVYLTQFDSFRVIELITDTNDRERASLSRHRLTRLLTPQTQENPIFFHSTRGDTDGFQMATDQMAEVGFEMYIFSFGIGFKLETADPDYLKEMKANIDYARSKGIEVGGYDLICLERGPGGYGENVGDQWAAIDPSTNNVTKDACFASGWYDKLNQLVMNFINQTGLSMLETDGPYGGEPCGSTEHDHHVGADDGIYWQTRLQGEMYKQLKEANVFINQPDYYFYQGGNKAGMGYNENQYSLPRREDLLVSRQGMYDDLYHFIPPQGWMFVPIVDYHGGGDAAMFKPLETNLIDYEWALAQYLGYGVAACYRGDVLYDGPNSKAVVIKWVSFYKKYRDILISDIVHVRRPDMQDYDAILHVNPFIDNRGLAMVFNPTQFNITSTLTLPLYYTGLDTSAVVYHEGQTPGQTFTLERDYSISLPLSMGPQTITWFLIKAN